MLESALESSLKRPQRMCGLHTNLESLHPMQAAHKPSGSVSFTPSCVLEERLYAHLSWRVLHSSYCWDTYHKRRITRDTTSALKAILIYTDCL